MHTFNRQVLEQVAKDGKTYVSLAKEMAKALLGETAQEANSPKIECIMVPEYTKNRMTQEYKDELKTKNIHVILFNTDNSKTTDVEGDTVYGIRLVKPEDL